MLVTLPGTYHQVVNTGPNYAQAVNFADAPDWCGPPREYRFCTTRCQADRTPISRAQLTVREEKRAADRDGDSSGHDGDPREQEMVPGNGSRPEAPGAGAAATAGAGATTNAAATTSGGGRVDDGEGATDTAGSRKEHPDGSGTGTVAGRGDQEGEVNSPANARTSGALVEQTTVTANSRMAEAGNRKADTAVVDGAFGGSGSSAQSEPEAERDREAESRINAITHLLLQLQSAPPLPRCSIESFHPRNSLDRRAVAHTVKQILPGNMVGHKDDLSTITLNPQREGSKDGVTASVTLVYKNDCDYLFVVALENGVGDWLLAFASASRASIVVFGADKGLFRGREEAIGLSICSMVDERRATDGNPGVKWSPVQSRPVSGDGAQLTSLVIWWRQLLQRSSLYDVTDVPQLLLQGRSPSMLNRSLAVISTAERLVLSLFDETASAATPSASSPSALRASYIEAIWRHHWRALEDRSSMKRLGITGVSPTSSLAIPPPPNPRKRRRLDSSATELTDAAETRLSRDCVARAAEAGGFNVEGILTAFDKDLVQLFRPAESQEPDNRSHTDNAAEKLPLHPR